MIFLDEPLRLKEQGEAVELEFRESMEHRLEKGYLLPGQTGLLYPVREILAKAQRKDTVYLTGLEQKLPGMTTEARFSFDVRNMNSYQNSFEMLIKDLTALPGDSLIRFPYPCQPSGGGSAGVRSERLLHGR